MISTGGSGRGTLATSSAVLPRVVIEPQASANGAMNRLSDATNLSSFRKGPLSIRSNVIVRGLTPIPVRKGECPLFQSTH